MGIGFYCYVLSEKAKREGKKDSDIDWEKDLIQIYPEKIPISCSYKNIEKWASNESYFLSCPQHIDEVFNTTELGEQMYKQFLEAGVEYIFAS